MSGEPYGVFERRHQLASPTVGLDMRCLDQLNLYEVGLPIPSSEAVANALACISPSATAFSIEVELRSIFRQVPLRVVGRREESFRLQHLSTLIGQQAGDPIASSRKEICNIVRSHKLGRQKFDMASLQVIYTSHWSVAVEILSMDGEWMPHVRAHREISALVTLDKLERERVAGNKHWLNFWAKLPLDQTGWTEVNSK
jgi:hypothetical protein